MKISKRFLAVLFVGLISLVAPAFANDITYTVDQTVGSGSVTGTITTDGTIGTLATADVIGWDLTLNDGTNTITLNSLNAATYVQVSGNALSATPTNLLFDFESSGPQEYFLFGNGTQDPGFGDVCWLNNESCANFGGDGITLADLNLDNIDPSVSLPDGDTVIATDPPLSTPEPGTGGLMLIGAGMLGLVMMRKRLAQGLPQPS